MRNAWIQYRSRNRVVLVILKIIAMENRKQKKCSTLTVTLYVLLWFISCFVINMIFNLLM